VQCCTILITGDGSKELSSEHTVEIEYSKSFDTPVSKSHHEPIIDLSGLDKKAIDDFFAKKEAIALKTRRADAEATVPLGLHIVEGNAYAVMPSQLFQSDNTVGAMLYDLCKFANITIKVIEGEAKFSKLYNEDFIRGLWFGTFSTVHLKRRRTKGSYELGRVCTQSLIVRNAYQSYKNLGLAALVQDNFFFGNKADEIHDKAKVVFHVKTQLRVFFEDATVGELVYGILNSALQRIGMTFLLDAEIDKTIEDALTPSDTLIARNYPTVTRKKGRKEEEVVRKPNPIKQSPLYTKEEMVLVQELTHPLFSDLDELTKQYRDLVNDLGFHVVNETVKRSITNRWETLQRFASVTKTRLQDIRKILKDEKIKKAAITRDNVTALLQVSRDRAGRLVSELKHILGRNDIIHLVRRAFKEKVSSEKEAWSLIQYKAFILYRDMDLKGELQTGILPIKISDWVEEGNFTKSLECLEKITKYSAAFKNNLKDFAFVKHFKLYGRFEQIKAFEKNLCTEFVTLASVPNKTVENALKYYFHGSIRDLVEFQKDHNESLKNCISRAQQGLMICISEEPDDNKKIIMSDFNKKLGEMPERISRSIYSS